MPQVSLLYLPYSEVYLLSGEKAVNCGDFFFFSFILFFLSFFLFFFFFGGRSGGLKIPSGPPCSVMRLYICVCVCVL